MCFSAVASFMAAGITGAVGVATVSKVRHPSELPLAAIPLLFAVQQFGEGLLWLALAESPTGEAAMRLTTVFRLFAGGLWPALAPAAVYLIERDAMRRRLMLPLVGLGLAVALYYTMEVVWHANVAAIAGGHIAYEIDRAHSVSAALAYLAATSVPLVLSAEKLMVGLGAVILAGCLFAALTYWQAFVSVWCFFAAAASVIILMRMDEARALAAPVSAK